MKMEFMMLNAPVHRLLSKQKKNLEIEHSVIIKSPEVHECSAAALESDIIFVTICGDKANVEKVKNYIRNLSIRNQTQEVLKKLPVIEKCVPVITLTDSDDEEVALSSNRQKRMVTLKKRKQISVTIPQNELSCDNQICSKAFEKVEAAVENGKKRNLDSASDFIPLFSNSNQNANKRKHVEPTNSSAPCKVRVPTPVPIDPARLRPVVIDGSNVARAHGMPTNTFSCKGIQLTVQFFLDRGHTNITAFVPLYRRGCRTGTVPTTGHEILEELHKAQRVVFTPSRYVQQKRVTCYDDRFIVDLASRNKGIILSNDNYKDLVDESEAFRKTIEERLLMYCFVGDLLMIPNDPLGKSGPTLEQFLLLPPDV